ncbi:hypothetical protein, partial [Tropheryma whipplei]|uniref:hypothetical protein n=1 Tax=Tropheryma whipplei TaxID=2039 RepID=UPI0019D3EFD2
WCIGGVSTLVGYENVSLPFTYKVTSVTLGGVSILDSVCAIWAKRATDTVSVMIGIDAVAQCNP